ncbi:hypothetical protein FZD47_05965 [Bacillus infantis]|uniref:Uncharacterized protein n=1 Tax=Bacillus infantis TaxID=324767 RepID=A0A5D4SNN4_9BACI|nr:hypothetical protein [Bacillus infantis]TYS64903.1 hypothetical protein FZD47_05965 [Bacillus infantis]
MINEYTDRGIPDIVRQRKEAAFNEGFEQSCTDEAGSFCLLWLLRQAKEEFWKSEQGLVLEAPGFFRDCHLKLNWYQ